jgi:hypothetical protein
MEGSGDAFPIINNTSNQKNDKRRNLECCDL